MALLELKRSLLLPAILLAASLTLVGCAGGPDNDSSNSSNSSSSDEDEDEEEAEEEEAEEDEASTDSNCPAGFVQAATDMVQQEASITILTPSDFSVPEVGTDFLASGCLFETSGDVDGTVYTTQAGYLPGDAAVVAEISANLAAAGFAPLADTEGFYTRGTTSIVVIESGELPGGTEAADPLNLNFGDSFIVLSVIQG